MQRPPFITFTLGAAILSTLALVAPVDAGSHAKKVFFLLPNSTTIRFERRDAPLYVEAMAERMPDTE